MTQLPTQLPSSTASNSDDEIDLIALFFSIYEKRVFIVVVTFCFLLLGIIYALMATPVYKANAVIQVEEKSTGIPGLSEVTEMFGEESSAITEIELIKSRRVIGVAVDKENLDISTEPVYFPVVGSAFARKGFPITLGNYANGEEALVVSTFTVPEEYFGEKHIIESTGSGGYLLISPEGKILLAGRQGELSTKNGYSIFVQEIDAGPKVQFAITKNRALNTILNYQQLLSVSEKGSDSGIIVLSLEDESPKRAEDILNEISDAYIRQNVERQSAEAQKSLEFLHNQLPEVRRNLETAEKRLNEFQVKAGSVDISVETEALLDQVVAIEADIAQLKLQKAELDRKYTKDHPTYVAWQEQLAELNQRKIELNDKVKGLPSTQQELLGLRRDVEVSTVIYTQMLNNIQELDIARAGAVGNVRLIDAAATNIEEPVKPNKKIIVALSFILGLFISIAIVVLRKAFHNGIETPEQIEDIGLPVYASIPLSETQAKVDVSKSRPGFHRKKLSPHVIGLLAQRDPTDISIESLRSLRTSLHFAMMEARNNVIMISGASPEVGKSFVASNLAAVVANSGKRVLIIDGDLRKGYLHKAFEVENTAGLSDALSMQVEINAVIKRTWVNNLFVIPRGSAPPNPSELLMSERFKQCLDSLGKLFDYIIVDTPPILAVTDAAIIGSHCGVGFLVVRYGVNSPKEVELSYKRFVQNNIPIKGAILNAIEKKSHGYGYGYGYKNYNYSYEYKPEQ